MKLILLSLSLLASMSAMAMGETKVIRISVPVDYSIDKVVKYFDSQRMQLKVSKDLTIKERNRAYAIAKACIDDAKKSFPQKRIFLDAVSLKKKIVGPYWARTSSDEYDLHIMGDNGIGRNGDPETPGFGTLYITPEASLAECRTSLVVNGMK